MATHRTKGFTIAPIHRRKEPKAFSYISERATFWIAILSILSFVSGNMMARSGFYAFWHAVWGGYDLKLIEYTGTTAPVASVPVYKCWEDYGGNAADHTYSELPDKCKRPLPGYDSALQRLGKQYDVYSVGFGGDYRTGAEMAGTHPGTDIRMPEGTPILAIANGIVTKVATEESGFGKYIVLTVPNAPDPHDPNLTITIEVLYAHLSAQLVTEGDVVRKGQTIGLSGKTGLASGAHLHFQMTRAGSPVWPYTTAELHDAHLSFADAINSTFHQERLDQYYINPMLYVQANYPSLATAKGQESTVVAMKGAAPAVRRRLTLAERKAARLAKRSARRLATAQSPSPANGTSIQASSASLTVSIQVPDTYQPRVWQKVRVELTDEKGFRAPSEKLNQDITLTTAFGSAEFRPKSVLSPLDFQNGVAEVEMLGLGDRTVVLEAKPLGVLSRPIKPVREEAMAP